jgi:hypothetical protein
MIWKSDARPAMMLSTRRRRKMTKITDSQYLRFKVECLRLQKEWGLLEYTLYFGRSKDNDEVASINADSGGCVARIRLCKQYDGDDMQPVEVVAKHEMIHLLTHRLYEAGSQRFASEKGFDDEWERLTVKLEKII